MVQARAGWPGVFLVSLSCLSHCLPFFVCLCVCLCLCLSVCLSVSLSPSLSLPLSLSLSLYNNNNNNNNRIQRRYSRFFTISSQRCELSQTYAQVAWVQSCANHVQHIERLSCVMLRATWYEGTAQLLSLTELKSHLLELYFIGWTIKPMKEGRKPEYPEKTPGDELLSPPLFFSICLSLSLFLSLSSLLSLSMSVYLSLSLSVSVSLSLPQLPGQVIPVT